MIMKKSVLLKITDLLFNLTELHVDYALMVKEKGEAEILNIGIIKSKQELNGDINKFLVDTNSTAFFSQPFQCRSFRSVFNRNTA